MKDLLAKAPRFLFFTGKGGVGKTSMACATALGLAESGKKVLLISTDPASNLDEVLATPLAAVPTPVRGVFGLQALNINPIQAAGEYRERMVGPYRGVLPEAAITQMEEQLSGACTVEIAGFNQFSRLLGDEAAVRDYDHIVLDTAPTGHTLRLLNLPAAWNDFIASNETGSSCLGPVAGLSEQKVLYERVVAALKNPAQTLLVLVTRPEAMALLEADRAGRELRELGLANQHLIVNGLFAPASGDPVAKAFAEKSSQALAMIPAGLKEMPTTRVSFRPAGVMGIEAMRAVFRQGAERPDGPTAGQLRARAEQVLPRLTGWDAFLRGLGEGGRGVIMTMGKGGVGKTTMAALIATHLAGRGHSVLLSTTDPAAHVAEVIGSAPPGFEVERIDPKAETIRYVEQVLACNRDQLTSDELALLEEELRSPCIEEIAVFQAFARTVARGDRQFVVLDTAPTGHTLLLLDATESYHREVAKSVAGGLPDEVRHLLPRIRDPRFTKVVVVALPEATPTHEASALQEDLRRAGIEPHGWIINRSFAVSGTADPALRAKGLDELVYIDEILERHARRAVLSPWVAEELSGAGNLRNLQSLLKP
jgi:arsenite/tail-anchored protein-transporting ATPase